MTSPTVPAPPLADVQVVSLAINLPGPAAADRLRQWGAQVIKVEPPTGDFLAAAAPDYYADLSRGQQVRVCDLKTAAGAGQVRELIEAADLLITSSRPSALRSLGLDPESVRGFAPEVCQVSIVGHPGDAAEEPGHDLTYQAVNGTLTPPSLPTILAADLAGAERAAAAALALLVQRERDGTAGHIEVALSDVAYDLAAPLRHGLTAPGGPLGGGLPQYAVHPTTDGYVAVAALEPHFWRRLSGALGIDDPSSLAEVLATRSSSEWERWAAEHDVPLAVVREAPTGG